LPVRNAHAEILAGGQARNLVCRQRAPLRFQHDLAADCARVHRVHDEIQQCCFELRRIDPCDGSLVAQAHRQRDSLADRTTQQRLGLANQLVQSARLGLQGLPACECEQLRGESLAPPRSDQRRFRKTLTARCVLRMAENDVERTDHHGQQIVEIVRDAARQPTQCV
jgi:hypothetical protein